VTRALDSGEQPLDRDTINRCEGQGNVDLAVAERGSLRAVKRNERQGCRRRGERDLGLSSEACEDDKVGVLGALGAREPRETQLPVELAAIVVVADDDSRALSGGAHLVGDTRCNDRVARDQS
jgi:hypothetical protein